MKSLERRADVSLTGIFQPDVRAVASHFRPPRPTFRNTRRIFVRVYSIKFDVEQSPARPVNRPG